ncbi:MAG: conjugal transfer protein TraL [Comamonas sp.]
MAKVHCVMQAKGGTGKSLVAALLAQYLARRGHAPLCIDADPVHGTLCGYRGLAARRLPWHQRGPFDARAFDAMLQWIAQTPQDVVIDSSASVCLPLLHFLASPRARPRLARISHRWIVHTLVAGGPAFTDTLDGFAQLVRQWPQTTRFVLWLNPFWGALVHQGQGVEALPAYRENRHRLDALLRLPELQPVTDGRALAALLEQRLTFDEALAMASLGILERQRLKQLQRALFAQLDLAMVQ